MSPVVAIVLSTLDDTIETLLIDGGVLSTKTNDSSVVSTAADSDIFPLASTQ